MNAADLSREMIEAKRRLENREREHDLRVREYAEADRAHGVAYASAFLAASGTERAREAHAKQATSDLRYKLKLSEGLAQSSLEAIRNGRQIISALQSLAAAQREEAHLARYMDRELENA